MPDPGTQLHLYRSKGTVYRKFVDDAMRDVVGSAEAR